MNVDLCDLIRCDHDDIGRVLDALTDPRTPRNRLTEQLETVRLAIAAHSVAEADVFENLRTRVSEAVVFALVSRDLGSQHDAVQETANELTRIRPGTADWYDAALDVRLAMLDHTCRAEQALWAIREYVPRDVREELAIQYATERLTIVSSSPQYRLAALRMSVQRA